MSPESAVAGERTVAQVAHTRSRAVRMQRRLALAFVGLMGAAVLVWYYLHIAEESRTKASAATSGTKAAASSEMKLPRLDIPAASAPRGGAAPLGAINHSERSEQPTEKVDSSANQGRAAPPDRGAVLERAPARGAASGNTAFARLTSPVLVRPTSSGSVGFQGLVGVAGEPVGEHDLEQSVSAADRPVAHGVSPGSLSETLVPTVTTPSQAALVPTRRWLLPKGSFLDCTLETAIDSTLPGMTSCVLATDVFGADGRIVLLERGTKLVGETRGEVRAGQARVAILWSEARTPTGVVVNLASPGTDALGRAGAPGDVDLHLGQRFGAAVLLSLIDGAVDAAVSRQQGSGSVVYNAQVSRDVATEALRNTINIPPTVLVAPGARIQVLVARDVDFRSVYRLNPRAEH